MPGMPTPQDDVITGTEARDVIDGLGGNDIIHGLGGNDNLSGGDGDDQVFGDDGSDSIGGNAGNDVLHGGLGDDVLYGVDGIDRLFGEDGDDLLAGGDGDDVLVGGRGNDLYYGNQPNGPFASTGYDRAIVDTNVSDALIEFSRGGGHDPAQITSYFEPFIVSSDGIDRFDNIDAIAFNDVEFSASAYELLRTEALYQTFMNREPTTAEYTFWNSRGAPVDQNVERIAILDSAEAQAAFASNINAIYRQFAGRDATVTETQTWNGQFHQANYAFDYAAVRAGVIAANDTYVAQLITGEYQTLFGRAPAASELATWKQAFVSAPSTVARPYGFAEGESHATPDTLVNALMSDSSSNGHVLQLRGTSGADVFTLPAGFTNVRIANFDPTQDRISFAGTAFAGTDPLDPAHARQTSDAYFYEPNQETRLTDGNVLIQLDATHRIIVEGAFGQLDREQFLSSTSNSNTIDTYYTRYFGRFAYSSEVAVWDRLFATGGHTFDTMIDTLLGDAGSAATGTQKLAGTAGADTLHFDGTFTNAVITGFDPNADRISTHDTAYAGIDPLSRAREIVGLDGATDVLIAFDATHAILLDHVTLAQLHASDFLI